MQKTNNLSCNYNRGDKCLDPTSSGSPGGDLSQVGLGREEKEGIVLPGRRNSQYKNGVYDNYNKSLDL